MMSFVLQCHFKVAILIWSFKQPFELLLLLLLLLFFYPHFTDEENEAQGGGAICLRSHC